jgi:hypothetical protein
MLRENGASSASPRLYFPEFSGSTGLSAFADGDSGV